MNYASASSTTTTMNNESVCKAHTPATNVKHGLCLPSLCTPTHQTHTKRTNCPLAVTTRSCAPDGSDTRHNTEVQQTRPLHFRRTPVARSVTWILVPFGCLFSVLNCSCGAIWSSVPLICQLEHLTCKN